MLILQILTSKKSGNVWKLSGNFIYDIWQKSWLKIKLVSFCTWYIGAAIPKGEFAKWDNQALSIPALPPSIINSRVVNVTYHVVIEVDVPWGFDPTINMPITMGTIPFRPAYQQITVPQIDPNAPPMGKKLTFSLIL